MIKTVCITLVLVSLSVVIPNRFDLFSVNAKEHKKETAMEVLKKGDTLPEVSVADTNGKPEGLRAIVARKPTVLIFYRGGWCPYCNVHLGKLQTIEKQVLSAGYQIIAVSPDRPEELRKTIEKHTLTYSLYSDSSMAAAKAFGLAFTVSGGTRFTYRLAGINLEKSSGQEHHMLPVPAVFLVGTDGVIRFAHSDPDYKVRLDPEKILEVIETTALRD